jgi:hypothetical protein
MEEWTSSSAATRIHPIICLNLILISFETEITLKLQINQSTFSVTGLSKCDFMFISTGGLLLFGKWDFVDT